MLKNLDLKLTSTSGSTGSEAISQEIYSLFSMGGFWDALWQQTYQVKSLVLGNVSMLRTTQTMEIYLVSLLPPSVPKSPIVSVIDSLVI